MSKDIEEKLEDIISVFENLRHRKPNLQVIGLKVDEIAGSFPYFLLPTDLLPIRDRHSPSLWNTIRDELTRKLPAKRRLHPVILLSMVLLALLGLFFLVLPHFQWEEEEAASEVVIEVPIEDEEAIADPGVPEKGLENEDCLDVFVGELSIKEESNGFILMNRNARMSSFRTRNAAEQAISLLRQLKIDKICYVGRPDPSLRYLLSNGQIPSHSTLDEDCISFSSPDNLVAREVSGGRYQISDGRSLLFMTDSKEEGERVIEVIQHYRARQICYVERPNPGLSYLKR
ncbi:hypothetical protein [Pleomorphovibrio marinus]|uniref:hypothetical protein n=1 Tax=Pleomorphovibrio marinus TaxID=2164132 RepID=UPI000E0C2B3F|nr:hypothetical protein [Pleomorphovibrio marinus]